MEGWRGPREGGTEKAAVARHPSGLGCAAFLVWLRLFIGCGLRAASHRLDDERDTGIGNWNTTVLGM